jgi:hypothetical protein
MILLVLTLAACQSSASYRSGGRLARTYTKVEDLFKDCDILALGSFTGATKTYDFPEAPAAPNKIRLQEFKPSRVLKGRTPEVLWVATYAQKEATGWIGIVGEALYQPDTTYVLFLTKEIPGRLPESHYWTTGAYQGSFRVKDGKVWARSELGESEETKIKLNGAALDAFLKQLEKMSQ